MALRARLLSLPVLLCCLTPALGAERVLSPDGRELAIERPSGQITIVNLARGGVRFTARPRPEAEGGEPTLDSIAWSPDGKRLAVLYGDGVVRLLGARSGLVEGEVATSPNDVEERGWLRRTVWWVDEERVVVSYGSAPTELWHVEGARPLVSLDSPGRRVTAVALSSDRTLLALGDTQGHVSVWAMPSGELVGRIPTQDSQINALDLDPQGNCLAVGTRDCAASTWSLADWSRLGSYSHCDTDIFNSGFEVRWVRFSPDGRHLLTTSGDLWVARVWRLEDARSTCDHNYGGGSAATLYANFVAGGRRVVLGIDGAILDTETGDVVATLPLPEPRRDCVWGSGDYVWHELDDHLRVWSVAEDGCPSQDIPLSD